MEPAYRLPSELSPAQADVVLAENPVLVCAVPGSGKTRVLVAKAQHILMTQPQAYVIITTFTREAAEEIKDRLRKTVPPEKLRRLRAGTIHSLARAQSKSVGSVGRILSEMECHHLLRRLLEDVGSCLKLEDATIAIESCKVDPEFAKKNPELMYLTNRYQDLLKGQGAEDFTDMMLQCVRGMDQGTIPPMKLSHLLVDEVQDCCLIQYQWLYHHLKGGAIATVVGDDDQSVYSFRRSRGFKGMMDFVERTGASIIALDTNYRSTDAILASASALIRHNLDRVPKKLVGVRGGGPAPRVIPVRTAAIQADSLVDEVHRLCESNPLPQGNERHTYAVAVRNQQIAVLARTNGSLRAVEKAFQDHSIPYVRAGRSIWDDKLLQVYEALLLSLHNRDGVGLEVAMKWAGVGDSMLRSMTGDGLWSMFSLIDPDEAQSLKLHGGPVLSEFLSKGRGWVDRLNGGSNSDVTFVVRDVLAWMSRVMSGLCGTSPDKQGVQPEGHSTHAEFAVKWKLDAACDALCGVQGSLASRLLLVKKEGESALPRVTLTTFHGSKGREWSNVIIIDVYAAVVPKCGADDSDEKLEEERRLFYVAMTRARDELIIYSRSNPSLISEFLHDAKLVN